jgi:hypothetical protein
MDRAGKGQDQGPGRPRLSTQRAPTKRVYGAWVPSTRPDRPTPVDAASIRAFADSAGFFGFDRRQTRAFLQRVAHRIEALEYEVQTAHDREASVGGALIAATEASQALEEASVERIAAREREAIERIEVLEREARVTRERLVTDLQQAAAHLDGLFEMLGLDPEASPVRSLHLEPQSA